MIITLVDLYQYRYNLIVITSRSTRHTDVLWVVAIWSGPTASCVYAKYIMH